MIKNGKHIQCTYCENTALQDTEPPVCEKHKELNKKAAKGPATLKELDVVPQTDDTVCISVRGNLGPADSI